MSDRISCASAFTEDNARTPKPPSIVRLIELRSILDLLFISATPVSRLAAISALAKRLSRISKWRPKCVRLLFCTNPGAFLSMSTEEEIRTQNDRLELLLNLTSKITSSLDLREVLRAVAANIREVIHAEGATVSLQDAA
jgi:hypothetical protein